MIGLIGVFCGKTGELIIFTNLAPRTPHPRQPTLLTYTSSTEYNLDLTM